MGTKHAGRRWWIALAGVVIAASTVLAMAPPAAAPLLPGPPQNVAANPFNSSSLDVWWSHGNPAGATYMVQVYVGAVQVGSNHNCTCLSMRVTGLSANTQYTVKVYGKSSLGLLGNPTTVGAWQPTPPANTPDRPDPASATASQSDQSVTVSWTSPTGVAETFIEITVTTTAGTLVNYARCFVSAGSPYPCDGATSEVVTGLTPGQQYVFYVAGGNASGRGVASGAGSNTVTTVSSCTSSTYCLAIDGTDEQHTAARPASGLLVSGNNVTQSALDPLQVTNWRVPLPQSSSYGLYHTEHYEAASASGAAITLIIADAWRSFSNTAQQHAATPWSNWTTYSNWVEQYVDTVVDFVEDEDLAMPEYWEVVNEPDNLVFGCSDPSCYFSVADAATVTLDNMNLMFRKTYEAVKDRLPAAKMMAPSLAKFAIYPGERYANFGVAGTDRSIDIGSVLDYSDDDAENPLVWDAIAWHDGDYASRSFTEWTAHPADQIIKHVQLVRDLLEDHPVQGDPEIVINEYGSLDRWVLPGWWPSGYAAAEASGLQYAGHSCFYSENTGGGEGPDNCTDDPSTLDGMLLPNQDRRPIWWVAKAYADMSYDTVAESTATVVAATSSDPSIGIFATVNDAGPELNAMVGRHVTCVNTLNADCPAGAGPPSATTVPLEITLPFSAPSGVDVTITRLPMTSGGAAYGSDPSPTTSQGTVTNGVVTVSLTNLLDGEAILVTVTPRS